MRDTSFVKGIVPPVVTPVDAAGKIDTAKLIDQIEWIRARGISGVLLFGSNSEFFMFQPDEMISALQVVTAHFGETFPVYFGIGVIRTSTAVDLARRAAKAGAWAVSILQPMFIKPDKEELIGHFRTIIRSIPDTPVLLYNNPGRTGYPIPQDVVEELAHSEKNLIGMKESSGDLTQVEEFIRRNADVHFKVLCGKDTLIYAGLCVGCVGAVCSTANYAPELVVSVYRKFVEGDLKGSLEAQYKLNPVRLLMDKKTFPVATKDMANIVGREVGTSIRPLIASSPALQKEYAEAMKKAGIF